MAQGVVTFVDGLEPWIKVYSFCLAALFAVGFVALIATQSRARRRLTLATKELSALPAADPLNGATQHAYHELLAAVDRLPDRGGTWWFAVASTVTRYERTDG